MGINVNTSSATYDADTTKAGYPIPIAKSTEKCNQEANTVRLYYQGCN